MRCKLPEVLRPDEAMHVLHFLHAMPGTSALLKITLRPLIYYRFDRNEEQLIYIHMYQNDRHGLRQFNHAEEVLLKDVPNILQILQNASSFFQPDNQCLNIQVIVNNSPCSACTPKLLQFKDQICRLGFNNKSLKFNLQFQHIYKPDLNRNNIRVLKHGGIHVAQLKWPEFYDSFSTWVHLNRSEERQQSSPSESSSNYLQSSVSTELFCVIVICFALLFILKNLEHENQQNRDATGLEKAPMMSRPTDSSSLHSRPTGASGDRGQLDSDEDIISHLYTVSKDWAVQFKQEQNFETRRELDSLL